MLIRYRMALLQVLAVAAVSTSYGFMDWSIYRSKLLSHSTAFLLYLHGGIDAPLQYRVGPWIIVAWAYPRLHEWITLTLLDVSCVALGLGCLIYAVRLAPSYERLTSGGRLASLLGIFALAEYYLLWGHWFQSTATMPSVLYVCLTALLITGRVVKNRWILSFLIVCLSCIQGLFRADVAVVLHAGFIIACLVFSSTKSIANGRLWLAITSLVAGLCAGLVQLYLMRVWFPNARYGSDGVIRALTNLRPSQWGTALIALAPVWLLLWFIARRMYRPDGIAVALLTSSLLYICVWFVVGLLQEARIFLPFGFALIPATSIALVSSLGNAFLNQTQNVN